MNAARPFSRLWSLLMFLLLLAVFLPVQPALADVAPPDFPPGANVLPGDENTMVRMESETVTIGLLKEMVTVTNERGNTISRGAAHVNAIFNMRNMGTQSESMQVRFPLGSLGGDGWGGNPEIQDFTVKINGRPVATGRQAGTGGDNQKYDGPWATFPVIFPAGDRVQLEVNYSDYGSTEYPTTRFRYILQTGAGWYGTIGSVDLIVRLPYAANLMNINELNPNYSIAGQDIRWHYDNLEPTANDDLYVRVVLPTAWLKVLIEEDNLKLNSKDGEAWGRLGKAYKEAIFEHHGIRCDEGGLQAYQKSLDAYHQAVTLLPNDGLWHAGYTDMLWQKISFCDQYAGTTTSEADKQQLGIELKAALALAPEAEITQFLDASIKANDPTLYNDYVSPYPTATPNPYFPMMTATAEAIAQETRAADDQTTAQAVVTVTQDASPSPTQEVQPVVDTPVSEVVEPTSAPNAVPTSMPVANPPARIQPKLCGSALIAPFLLVGIMFSQLRKKKKN